MFTSFLWRLSLVTIYILQYELLYTKKNVVTGDNTNYSASQNKKSTTPLYLVYYDYESLFQSL